ncbi:hypothetical protein [Urechidicola vernalis]|uniref:Uncharacterized protein n=1 Tax=Urechidicola vernalis TaxID=3075600 RepID=A0ABU2Y7Z4_9FLAO|nr:hypothetical protein [Urechidicola sp. P050]MDT0553769.1 hypothetical protein [Urechidicola sp. P050]
MKQSIVIFGILLAILSCNQREEKNPNEFITATGKVFTVNKVNTNSASLASLIIETKGFKINNEFTLTDIDPVMEIKVTDLDNNGYDELYIITRSAGSGSYATVYGYASNQDKSVTPIYIPEFTEKDFEEGALFEAYQGHDTFVFENDRLIRYFPIYLSEDINSEPVEYQEEVIYKLEKGEASWQLKIE